MPLFKLADTQFDQFFVQPLFPCCLSFLPSKSVNLRKPTYILGKLLDPKIMTAVIYRHDKSRKHEGPSFTHYRSLQIYPQ